VGRDGLGLPVRPGHAVGLDERTYVYMHSKSTKNFFRVNDPTIDELVTKLRQTPDRAEQRAIAKRVADREHDQVLRMWMPYDSGFVITQPHVRNASSGIIRRTDGYGASAIARVWLDK
jgi:ABC-type transport system substrate-binding protein